MRRILGAGVAAVLVCAIWSAPPASAAIPAAGVPNAEVTNRIAGWGNGALGQLGPRLLATRLRPAPVSVATALAGRRVTSVAVGGSHVCAIADGRTACWGAGHAGQLGTKKWDQALAPVATAAVSDGYPARGVSALSAGGASTCAISRQRLYCWGDGRVLGRGNAPDSATARPVLGALRLASVQRVDLGDDHGCAVASGVVRCWGVNASGQLGVGDTTNRYLPAQVRSTDGFSNSQVSQVSAGTGHTCALRAGAVWCWGDNSEGQLGDGSTDNSTVPVRVGGALTGQTIVGITAGATHTCARTTSHAWCWGSNGYGELGSGTAGAHSADPVAVLAPDGRGALTKISDLRAGRDATCAVSTAVALCWGANDRGALGDGSVKRRSLPVIVVGGLMAQPTSMVEPAGSSGVTCAVNAARAYCWGDGGQGGLGSGRPSFARSVQPVTGVDGPVTALGVGESSSCALAAGTVRCWGWNMYGQLGTGTYAPRATAAPVSGLPGPVSRLAQGDSHVCAIAGGAAYCWGAGSEGQLGVGPAPDGRQLPVRVGGALVGHRVTAIAAGNVHTCAVADATLYCWGWGADGQLGRGSTGSASVPTRVPLPGPVTAVVAGANSTCAIAASRAYCWGAGSEGQLGRGSRTRSLTPVAVGGALARKPVTRIAIGESHACAVADQTYCWGAGLVGELGDGRRHRTTLPSAIRSVPVLAGRRVVDLSVGRNSSCVVAGGVPVCWGQIPDGGTALVPTRVPLAGTLRGAQAVRIAAGDHSLVALRQ